MNAPARQYTWPPFAPENEAALRHGAYSPRRVQPLADQLSDQLGGMAPWVNAPAFTGTVHSWSWAESEAALLRAFLDEVGLLDGEGEPRPAAKRLERVEARLHRLRDSLGLSPSALGSLLGKAASIATATGDTGALDELKAEGRRILDARAAAELETGTDD